MPAQAAEVVSSNIVGYQKVGLVGQGTLNLLATPFVAVGGENADINELTSSDTLGESSVAQFWNASTRKYTTVFYYPESADGGIYNPADENDCWGAGWGDVDQNAISQEMIPGEGFWIQAAGADPVVTLAGEVSVDTVTVDLVGNGTLNLLGNPFPLDIDIQQVTSDTLGESSVAQFWDASTRKYTTVFYYPESADGGIYNPADEDDCWGAGWGDVDQNAVQHTIRSGEGFWIQAAGANPSVAISAGLVP